GGGEQALRGGTEDGPRVEVVEPALQEEPELEHVCAAAASDGEADADVAQAALAQKREQYEAAEVASGDDDRRAGVAEREVDGDQLARAGDHPNAEALSHQCFGGFAGGERVELAALQNEHDERFGQGHE